jgi:hypothetical protein
MARSKIGSVRPSAHPSIHPSILHSVRLNVTRGLIHNPRYTDPIQTHDANVGSEVLTAVVMKSPTFWDITPCSPLKVIYFSEEHVASIFRV